MHARVYGTTILMYEELYDCQSNVWFEPFCCVLKGVSAIDVHEDAMPNIMAATVCAGRHLRTYTAE